MAKPESDADSVAGSLWINREGQPVFAAGQVALLEAIGREGSISGAARRLGISYKTAWDRVDGMNNLAGRELVVRATGGRRGGGTALTDEARRMMEGFRAMEAEHRRFLRRMSEQFEGFEELQDLARRLSVKTSARNQFHGTVTHIVRGPVNAEVELRIAGGHHLVAVITEHSLERLGLSEGSEAYALIKASSVILATDPDVELSARNKLCGTVSRVSQGPVDSDVVIDLGGGATISAVVTTPSFERMDLDEGVVACALFKASSVILAGA